VSGAYLPHDPAGVFGAGGGFFSYEERSVDVKGRGATRTYLVTRADPPYFPAVADAMAQLQERLENVQRLARDGPGSVDGPALSLSVATAAGADASPADAPPADGAASFHSAPAARVRAASAAPLPAHLEAEEAAGSGSDAGSDGDDSASDGELERVA
jgi:hypothetical protein